MTMVKWIVIGVALLVLPIGFVLVSAGIGQAHTQSTGDWVVGVIGLDMLAALGAGARPRRRRTRKAVR